jgi:hypothetical protein
MHEFKGAALQVLLNSQYYLYRCCTPNSIATAAVKSLPTWAFLTLEHHVRYLVGGTSEHRTGLISSPLRHTSVATASAITLLLCTCRLTCIHCQNACCGSSTCLLGIQQQVSEVFHRAGRPLDEPVFAAGIGNRETDALAYQVRAATPTLCIHMQCLLLAAMCC